MFEDEKVKFDENFAEDEVTKRKKLIKLITNSKPSDTSDPSNVLYERIVKYDTANYMLSNKEKLSNLKQETLNIASNFHKYWYLSGIDKISNLETKIKESIFNFLSIPENYLMIKNYTVEKHNISTETEKRIFISNLGLKEEEYKVSNIVLLF